MSATEAIEPIRLSKLTSQIQAVIELNFNELSIWVVADITNHSFKERTNYHYFDLVEKADHSNELLAKIAGKAWGSGSVRIRQFEQATGQQFTNNIHVLVRVKVNYHNAYGLSLDIQDIDSNFTMGMLERQRQDTLARLVENNPGVIEKDGNRFITRNARLPLPFVIQRIAVLSSKTSAGNEDFRHTLANNPFGYRFDVREFHTVVQNEANATQFLDSLIEVFNSGIPFDVVVINRGGGAQTDFLIFDNYKIGLAVARFPIPIITGIGHQKNETITDLMAHTQTKTPTKAAEFIIAHNRRFEDAILNTQKSIIIRSQQTLAARSQALNNIRTSVINQSRTFLNDYKDQLVSSNQVVINQTKSLLFHHRNSLSFVVSTLVAKPKIITGNKARDLANTLENIKSFKSIYLRNQVAYLSHFKSVLNLMSPDNILRKGFAIVKHKGEVTSNPEVFIPGSDMEVILSGKSIQSTVNSISNHDGSEFNL